jgi:hypothetical protein
MTDAAWTVLAAVAAALAGTWSLLIVVLAASRATDKVGD